MLSYARNWWLVALRGLILVLLGIAALVWPGITLAALVIWVGIGLLFTGFTALAVAIMGRDIDGRGWLALEGVIGIIAGIVAFVYPGITQFVLLWLVAAWAIVTGIAELVAAVRLRRVIRGEWLLAFAGVISVLFGLLIIARPIAGLLTLALLIGWYAIIYGAALIALGFRLRHLRSWLEGDVAAGMSAGF